MDGSGDNRLGDDEHVLNTDQHNQVRENLATREGQINQANKKVFRLFHDGFTTKVDRRRPKYILPKL